MTVERWFLRVVVLCLFAVMQVVAPVRVAFADIRIDSGQSSARLQRVAIDVEPPLIEHDVVPEADAGVRQAFVATVVDDEELKSVRLFYRFEGERAYSSLTMNRLSYSSSWLAQVPTDPDDRRSIEYYLEARDASGNRTVRGYTFNPLVRRIIGPPVVAAVPPAPPAADEKGGISGRTWLYVALGVLAVGVAAGSLGGGDGGSGEGDGGGGKCGADGCVLTLDVERPFD